MRNYVDGRVEDRLRNPSIADVAAVVGSRVGGARESVYRQLVIDDSEPYEEDRPCRAAWYGM